MKFHLGQLVRFPTSNPEYKYYGIVVGVSYKKGYDYDIDCDLLYYHRISAVVREDYLEAWSC